MAYLLACDILDLNSVPEAHISRNKALIYFVNTPPIIFVLGFSYEIHLLSITNET